MKIIKIIVLFATISFFTSIPSAAEAKKERDCSEVKVIHQKVLCLFGYKKYGRELTEEEKKTNLEKKKAKEKAREEADSLEDLAKKIKKDPNKPKTLKDLFKNFKLPKALQPRTE